MYQNALFHVSNFPLKADNTSILAPFISAGFDTSTLEVIWIDDLGVFVHVNVDLDPSEVASKVVTPEGWKVQSYAAFLDSSTHINDDSSNNDVSISMVTSNSDPISATKRVRPDI
jgi:hypothetical protein